MTDKTFVILGAIAFACFSSGPAAAAGSDPIRIGVIAEFQAVAGSSIPGAAQIAADEINASGGIDGRKVEIVAYDDHGAAADAVRAFQRAVNDDHVNAVIASYLSEVVLALQPWSARTKTILVTPGASSDVITENIAKDYDHLKYSFEGFLTSSEIADVVCSASADLLVRGHKVKSAFVMNEDAAWTIPLQARFDQCLTAAGLQIADHIRFSPDTADFTPIFNKIETAKAQVIITGISHVGVQPTVQWQNQQVPIPMFGRSSQATNASFWKDTNGSAEGVVFQDLAAPDVAITPKTVPFAEAFRKKFGNYASYTGYDTYDAVYYITDAIRRAGSNDPDKLVEAMEKTDYVGTIGHIKFLPRTDAHPHSMVIGKGGVTGLMMQWQNGREVTVWPADLANGQMKFPDFVKLPE